MKWRRGRKPSPSAEVAMNLTLDDGEGAPGGWLQNCNFLPLDIFLLVCYNKDTEGGKKND